MTPDDLALLRLAKKKMAMIEHMVDQAEAMCGGCIQDLFDVTVASPGIVISLYMSAIIHVELSDLSDALKTNTQRNLQMQVQKLLEMVLAVVRSDNPREALKDLGGVLGDAIAMGRGLSDEIH